MSPSKPARGGARKGAGRPPGSGRCGAGQDLTQLRLARADKAAVLQLLASRRAQRADPCWRLVSDPDSSCLPLYSGKVAAGSPTTADEGLEDTLDLNRYLIDDASSTFMVRVKGDSMQGAGIGEGDLLLVERGREARHGQIVLAIIDGEFTVKRLHQRAGKLALLPENPAFAPIELLPGQEMSIWGVVSACIKKF
jgi:DNA polymerase V